MEKRIAIVDAESRKIINIVVFANNQNLEGMTFPNTTYPVDCSEFNVNIGDRFEDGKFFRGEIQIKRNINSLAKITQLENQINMMQSVLDELLMGGL